MTAAAGHRNVINNGCQANLKLFDQYEKRDIQLHSSGLSIQTADEAYL